jgi:uroporphyrinogen III methyltransferase / synthase
VAEAFPSALAGKKIVITRSVEQSEELCRELYARGATPIVFPVVSFRPPEDYAALDDVLRNLAEADWLLLTSQNAAYALHERAQSLGIDLSAATTSTRIGVVGPRTAQAAAEAGLRVTYVAREHRGFALAQELAGELAGRSVFVPRSDLANSELVDALRSVGARVTAVVAYRTVLSGSESRGKFANLCDAILFFSPSAVRGFADISVAGCFAALQEQAAIAAIGPVTASALRGAGVENVVQAQDVSVAGILKALEDYFADRLRSSPAGVRRG